MVRLNGRGLKVNVDEKLHPAEGDFLIDKLTPSSRRVQQIRQTDCNNTQRLRRFGRHRIEQQGSSWVMGFLY